MLAKRNPANPPLSELIYSPNAFARGVALHAYGARDIPEYMKNYFNIQSREDLKIKPVVGETHWTLCSTSEQRMNEAIDHKTTLLASGLMIKLRGRITAICYETFSTSNGTFVKGNFYSPDNPTQEYLKESFLNGASYPSLPEGSWNLIRSVNEANTGGDLVMLNVIRRAKRMNSRIPESPADYKTRMEYIEKRKENYNDR